MIARAIAATVLIVALGACRDRAAPTRDDAIAVAPKLDPRPRPTEIAYLTLKVLGMT